MVSITLSVPEEVRARMRKHDEVNWSAIARKAIEAKAEQLALQEQFFKQVRTEEASGFTQWTVEMGRKVKKDMVKRLHKEGRL